MKNLLTVFAAFIAFSSFAQDTIVKSDSTRIIAKVIHVTDKNISYKRHNDPDGATYETSRRHVARIAYANGARETYGMTEDEAVVMREPNIVSITTTDLMAGVITANYERIIFGQIGVRVIGSMGILGTTGKISDVYNSTYYYNRYKIFSAGIDLHYFVVRGPRISYYTGGLIEYGQVRQRSYTWWEWPPYPAPSKIEEYYFGGLTNGVQVQAGKNINLDMFCSLGWRHGVTGYSDFAARMGFSLGYQF